MKLPSLKTLVRFGLVVPLSMLTMLPLSACSLSSEADALESILRSTDAVDGEITIVNQDGRKVTLKIITEDAAETEGSKPDTSDPDSPSNDTVGTDWGADGCGESQQAAVEGEVAEIGENEITVECDTGHRFTIRVTDSTRITLAGDREVSLAELQLGVQVSICFAPTTLLPSLQSIEDVFSTLGKWEKAVVQRENGLTWAQVARELGFGPDGMHSRLLDIAKENVYAAKHAGCLTLDQANELLNQFSSVAQDRVDEIFADSEESPCNDLDETTLLPSLQSIEDVFSTLGKWEKAMVQRENGLTWAQVARELGFGPDSMHSRLLDIAKESVYAAKHAGCLTLDQANELLNQFSFVAQDRVDEIFADS